MNGRPLTPADLGQILTVAGSDSNPVTGTVKFIVAETDNLATTGIIKIAIAFVQVAAEIDGPTAGLYAIYQPAVV